MGRKALAAGVAGLEEGLNVVTNIAIAILASVSGLAAAALAPIPFYRAGGDGPASLRSRQGLGLLGIFAAGCLLAVGGQSMLIRQLSYGPAYRAETLARMQMALM